MSQLSEKILAKTSKGNPLPALLVLEDGTFFKGWSCGADTSNAEVFGEICFNTSLEGYLEVITDPSYAGQIITMTYPQVGNYGVNRLDVESTTPALRGLVVRDMCQQPSNWRSDVSLPDFLKEQGIIAIEGVDTRSLVRHIRNHGAMKAGIFVGVDEVSDALLKKVRQSPSLVGANLVKDVSCSALYTYTNDDRTTNASFAQIPQRNTTNYNVIAYDCGAKTSILDGLRQVGCNVEVIPWDTPATEVLRQNPDGVFLSNGPGDPDAVDATYKQVEKLLGKVPLFGICLGHQMICKAAGASMEKLKYGHRGGNQPVMNLLTGRVEITAQNHGFNLLFPSLGPLISDLSDKQTDHLDDLRFWVEKNTAPVVANKQWGAIQLTHVNLNDGTAEGIAFKDIPAFSVQYHPEAHPGPTDSHYLFTAFTKLMDGDPDYLDIDIAKDRLVGWRF